MLVKTKILIPTKLNSQHIYIYIYIYIMKHLQIIFSKRNLLKTFEEKFKINLKISKKYH